MLMFTNLILTVPLCLIPSIFLKVNKPGIQADRILFFFIIFFFWGGGGGRGKGYLNEKHCFINFMFTVQI